MNINLIKHEYIVIPDGIVFAKKYPHVKLISESLANNSCLTN